MTEFEYTQPDTRVTPEDDQIALIREVERQIDAHKTKRGVHVERKPVPDMSDIDFALGQEP